MKNHSTDENIILAAVPPAKFYLDLTEKVPKHSNTQNDLIDPHGAKKEISQ